jgi:hypothetical protein
MTHPRTLVLTAALFLTGAAHAQWSTTGNTGLNGNSNFLGTIDAVPLTFRSNNTRVMSLFNAITVVNTDTYSGVNVLGGSIHNLIENGVSSGTCFGGININGNGFGNLVYDVAGTVSGGFANQAGTNDGLLAGNIGATVGGGRFNRAFGSFSTIGGGDNNRASGLQAVVPGGINNSAGGRNSFAGGQGANVRDSNAASNSFGDQGTFIWADTSTSSQFTSTGDNQFLIRASGGTGIGTTNPRGVLETSGSGVFQRPQLVMSSNTNTANDSWSRLAFTNTSTNQFWHFAAKANSANPGDDQLNYYYQDANGNGRNPLQIRGDGRVSIGGASPAAGITLDVFGAVRCFSLTQTSSGKYKTNVTDVGSVLDRFTKLRPVTFTWDKDHGGSSDVGLIAEEVAALFPEAVTTIEGSVEGINYARLNALAVKAVKEQQQQIEQRDAKITDLETRLARMEARMEAMAQAAVSNQK